MLKDILLSTIDQIEKLEAREAEIMKDCINKKLERSLSNYESELESTCRYVLTRNSITMIKALSTVEKPKEQEEEMEDDELPL